MGTDLAGKVGEQLDINSFDHIGTIADQVGDNIGDVAGIGADLHASLVEAICAALVMSTTSWPLLNF